MSNNQQQPPAHVLNAAMSLKNRDVQAVKAIYQHLFIADLNSESFYSDMNVIDVAPFDDNTLLSLPSSPPLVSSKPSLPLSSKTNHLENDIV